MRTLLLLLVAGIAGPLVLLSAGGVWYAYKGQRQSIENRLQARAQAASLVVDQEFDNALSALRVLSASQTLSEHDLAGFARMMRLVAADDGAADVVLMNGEGRVVQSTSQVGSDPASRAFLRATLQSGVPAVSDLIGSGDLANRVGVAAPAPAKGGKPAWSVGLFFSQRRLDRSLASLKLPDKWLVSLSDRRNRIVARNLHEAQFLGRLVPPRMIARRRLSDSGVIDDGYRSLDGVPTVIAFARAPMSGYVVSIGIPETQFVGPLRATLLRTGLLAAFFCSFGIGLALVVSRRIASALEAVAQLGPNGAPRTGLREIDALSQTIVNAEARRRESEARLELATEAGDVGVWDWNLTSDLMTFSERAKAIYGFPLQAPITFEMVRDATHPEDLPRTSEMAKRALDPNLREQIPYEYRINRPDGTVRWILAQGRAVFDDVDGAPRACRYIGTLQDITDRKAIEQSALESESRLRLALEAGQMAEWELDLKADSMAPSPAFSALLGVPELQPLTLKEIIARLPPGEEERLREAAKSALARGERYFTAQHRLMRPDGRLCWLMERAEFLFKNGQPSKIVGVAVDVTEHKRTEGELREHQRQLQELLATIDLAAVFVRDLDGRIRFWSRGCERLYGWSSTQVLGRSVFELLRVITPIPQTEIDAALLASGEWEGDVVHHDRFGQARIISLHKSLRRGVDGRPSVVLENARDVTALRETQEKLRALNLHLESRVRSEILAREAAQNRAAQAERMQALGLLAGGIAHDFNNVLQAIGSGVALIERRPGDIERTKKLIKGVIEAAERGASITRRLLVFARRSDLHLEQIDVVALLEGVKELLAHTLGDEIAVELDVAPNLPDLETDCRQLETVLINLASNSRDAMTKGGVIILRCRKERVAAAGASGLDPGDYLAISVVDNGGGMSGETLARATEPFFSTKRIGEGTGLGLSSARGFAEQSNGALTIDSELGCGTTATLWLPYRQKAAAAGRPKELARPFEHAALSARILLVDDDAQVRESLAEGLVDFGHSVHVATCCEDALALLRGGAAADCLITDLSMPDMNGVALIRAIRQIRPDLPAILLTGYGSHDAIVEAGDIERVALLWKPADPARIDRRVREVLSGEDEGLDRASPAS